MTSRNWMVVTLLLGVNINITDHFLRREQHFMKQPNTGWSCQSHLPCIHRSWVGQYQPWGADVYWVFWHSQEPWLPHIQSQISGPWWVAVSVTLTVVLSLLCSLTHPSEVESSANIWMINRSDSLSTHVNLNVRPNKLSSHPCYFLLSVMVEEVSLWSHNEQFLVYKDIFHHVCSIHENCIYTLPLWFLL